MSTSSTAGTGPDVLRVEVLGRAEESAFRAPNVGPPPKWLELGPNSNACWPVQGSPDTTRSRGGAALDDLVPPG
jgi:hypothetical protein